MDLLDVVTGAGVLAGIAALITVLWKVRPEAGQVVVTAAEGAVVVQSGVIKELKDELFRVHSELERERNKSTRYFERLEKLEKDIERSEQLRDKIDMLAARVYTLEGELDRVQRERDSYLEKSIHLAERVEELEAEVARLKENQENGT